MDPPSSPLETVVCENCAGEDEDLAPVWRLPAVGSDTPELWCADCRDRYAHEPADEAEEGEDAGEG